MVEDVSRDGMFVTPLVDFLTLEGSKLSRPMAKGELVMVVSGSPGVPAILNVDACIHDGFVGFRGLDLEKVSTEFLYFWFLFRLVENDKHAVGAIFRNLTTDQIKAFDVPILSIKIQRQIATRLKSQLAEVEIARQAAVSQLREVTSLADAIVMHGALKTPTSKHSLGEVLVEVKKGIGKNWSDYPVLGATRDGLAPAREQPGKQAPKYKPAFPGTVFYNPMRILIGSIAFVDDDDAPGITSPDYVALQGKPGVVDSRWFYFWLRSPLGVKCISTLARGAVRERMLFNRLAEGFIDLPDFAVQQKASTALKELKAMRSAVQQKIQEIDLLPQKILAQAFSP
jgi:type I restriction enzyme S subunit